VPVKALACSVLGHGVSVGPHVHIADHDESSDLHGGAPEEVHIADDVWLAASVTWNPAQVFADSARLTPFAGAPEALPAKSFLWQSGVGLYVNTGDDNPGSHRAAVGRRLYGFRMTGSQWYVLDGFAVTRSDGRRPDQLRPARIEIGFLRSAEGSARVRMGETVVICAATVEERVDGPLADQPDWQLIPAIFLTALVHCPGGAAPTGYPGYYPQDAAHLALYLESTRKAAAFTRYLEDHVLGREG
jgi:hypothetical protein